MMGGMTTRIGPMVATLAKAQGLTYGDLAAKLGMHRNRLGDKIAGRRAFREQEIIALADFFGVSPGHLFEDPLVLLGIDPVRKSDQGLLTCTFNALAQVNDCGQPGRAGVVNFPLTLPLVAERQVA